MLCPYYNNSCKNCNNLLMIQAQKCVHVQRTMGMSEQELDKYIPMKDLKDGYTYQIDGRNCCVGIYNEKQIGFHYRRCKFGNIFLDTEYHWDIGTVQPDMEHYGTVKPIREIEKAPTFNNEDEMIAYLNKHSYNIQEAFL